ncbi:hypothetical protein TKK_0002478 [Trichogramma kaykai]|uniref:SCD domain-containing protein n=2 Tax=Trichogramma kaykai TaxID=54128 RepID=A0ABD2VX43_9HYME
MAPRKTKRSIQINEDETESQSSLYTKVLTNMGLLEDIADTWVKHYEMSHESALLEFLQFMNDASGGKTDMMPEMLTMGIKHLIKKMEGDFDPNSKGYPLISSGKIYKKFKENLSKFSQELIAQCEYSIICDDYLMENLICVLIEMSDSPVRAFRHTATLVAMNIMTALADMALTVSDKIYEIEDRKKIGWNDSVDDKLKGLIENLKLIQDMLLFMFKKIFILRFRDISPAIRILCIGEIGIWMEKIPEQFLKDEYLKYIGWTLYDSNPEVRLKCLRTLQILYASEEFKNSLDNFTGIFKDRLVAMCLDIDIEVAIQAIKLMSVMYNSTDLHIISAIDCEQIYSSIFSPHRGIAQAAAGFMAKHIFNSEENFQEITKSGKECSPNTPYLRELIDFLIESEVPENVDYLVDSLIDIHPMLEDWEAMTDLLLEEPVEDEKLLSSLQKTSLIAIMLSSIKQLSTGQIPIARKQGKQKFSTKETKRLQNNKLNIARHFVQILPGLLERFNSDTTNLEKLLNIPQYFELEVYVDSTQEQNLKDLLRFIHEIVDRYHNPNILYAAAKTLDHLCDTDLEELQCCKQVLDVVLKFIMDSYKNTTTDFQKIVNSGSPPSEDDIFNICKSLSKVAVFSSYYDMNEFDIWDTCFESISDSDHQLPIAAIVSCFEACYFSLIWLLNYLTENADFDNQSKDKCQLLKERLRNFILCMMYYLDNKEGEIPMIMRETAYCMICDLLIIFDERLSEEKNCLIHELIYKPDKDLLNLLLQFIQDTVFYTSEESPQQTEELHKKSNILAGYCKLVMHKIAPIQSAAYIFKNYFDCNEQLGDVIKKTISSARRINKTSCALAILKSLMILYRENVVENQDESSLKSLKENARKFALLFGPNISDNSAAMLDFHREGILFAVTSLDEIDVYSSEVTLNLPFFDILHEFVVKVPKTTKKSILQFLDAHLKVGKGKEFKPMQRYRNSLL